MTFIDPAEQASWDNQRRRAGDVYKQQGATFAFQRSNAQQNQGLDTANLARRYDRMRESLPGGFARRGLLNSGIYGRGLQNYGQDRQAASADLAARYQQMLGGIGLQEQGASVDYTNAIGSVNDQEMVRRAQLAAALRGIAV